VEEGEQARERNARLRSVLIWVLLVLAIVVLKAFVGWPFT
jgi:predicted nucleic acid-binding Zn ribbon protein